MVIRRAMHILGAIVLIGFAVLFTLRSGAFV